MFDIIRTLFSRTPKPATVDPEVAAGQRQLAHTLIQVTAYMSADENRDKARMVPDSYSIVLVRPYTGVEFLQWGLTGGQALHGLPAAVEERAAFYRRINVPSTNTPLVMPTGEALALHDKIQAENAEKAAAVPPPPSFEEQMEKQRQSDLERLQHLEDYPDPERRRRFLLSLGFYEPETNEDADSAA